ncbi:hypothetical protein SAMN04489731_107433 [Amycolatopsis regifaucium]|nr:hypothetical protein SAMN04489731_107433 [Amycolatopsis regifaucium]
MKSTNHRVSVWRRLSSLYRAQFEIGQDCLSFDDLTGPVGSDVSQRVEHASVRWSVNNIEARLQLSGNGHRFKITEH